MSRRHACLLSSIPLRRTIPPTWWCLMPLTRDDAWKTVLLLAAAAAQPTRGATAIPETMIISASGGHYNDANTFALPCKNGQLSAVMRLSNLQFAEIWQASASIRIASADANASAMLGAVTKNQKPDHLYALWQDSRS